MPLAVPRNLLAVVKVMESFAHLWQSAAGSGPGIDVGLNSTWLEWTRDSLLSILVWCKFSSMLITPNRLTGGYCPLC